MNESQRRAWRALKLGPEWAERTPAGEPADAPEPVSMSSPQAVAGVPVEAVPRAESTSTVERVRPDESTPTAERARPAESTPTAERARLVDAAEAEAPDASPAHAEADPGSAPERRRAIDIATLDWQPLRERVAACTACSLCRTRSRTVFGVGATRARWMLVGEAPGAEEDARGEPFVGKAGQLLDAMLSAIGLDRRADVFIANVLKCRPPRNRDPQPEEVAACEPFLLRQLELVAPDVVVVLGRFAAQSVLGTDASIASLRGKLHRKTVGDRSIPLVVTYHPAYLLRTPADKSKTWADLLLARRSALGAKG